MRRLPGRCVGTAQEVAQVVVMLITNVYVTGEVVHVERAAASCQKLSEKVKARPVAGS